MALVVFAIASAMVLVGAISVVAMKNPVHSALGLVLTLFGVAVHFIALQAHFLAAVQVIVYAGAIVVLFLFVIMLLGVDKSEDLSIEPFRVQRPLAIIAGVGLVGLIVAAVARAQNSLGVSADQLRFDAALRDATNLGDVNLAGALKVKADNEQAYDNVHEIARNLYGDHIFAFEFTSVLLIVAVVGTVLMTRKSKKGGVA